MFNWGLAIWPSVPNILWLKNAFTCLHKISWKYPTERPQDWLSTSSCLWLMLLTALQLRDVLKISSGGYLLGASLRGVNRGMQNPPIHAFFRQICRSAKIFVQIGNHKHIQRQNVNVQTNKLVNVNATVNFTQTVKNATCLLSKTQYNSNNSITPELKWASFEKKKKKWMNSLTHRPRLKKDLWSKFRFRHQDRHNPESTKKFTADPRSTVFFKIRQSARFYPKKTTIRALFKAR